MQMSMINFCEYMTLYSSMSLLYTVSVHFLAFIEDCMNYFNWYIPLFQGSVSDYGNKPIAKTGFLTENLNAFLSYFPSASHSLSLFLYFIFLNPKLHPQLYDNKTQYV